MKILCLYLLFFLFAITCEDEKQEALDQEEVRLKARIEELHSDIEMLSHTVASKKDELRLIKKALDSLDVELLKK